MTDTNHPPGIKPSADELLARLDAIEREVRKARGEQIENTPWDFNIPTGNDLRSMRQQCNLTLEDVAEELDYTTSHIGQVENGSRAPGREFIQKALLLYKQEWPR